MAHPVVQTLNRITNEANATFVERRNSIECILLGILTNQHSFLLGPPGVAKSALARDILSRITSSTYFEVLLSKTRPDQAILGPYNLPLLRDEGKFRRQIDGYLLTADYAMLDEVGKMSPTTGHDLLAALNERIRHEVDDAGNSAHPIPLRSAVTASNELLTSEGEDARAMWDRLLLRTVVDDVREPGNFIQMLSSSTEGQNRTTIDSAALWDAVDNDIPMITIPRDVFEAIVTLRDKLKAEGIQPSSRRWKQSMRVLQAAAFLAGRTEVSVDDLRVAKYLFWEEPSQIMKVERTAMSISNPLSEDIMRIVDSLNEIRVDMDSRKGKSTNEKTTFAAEALGKLKTAEGELGKLKQKCVAAQRSTALVDDAMDSCRAVKRYVMSEGIGLDPDGLI